MNGLMPSQQQFGGLLGLTSPGGLVQQGFLGDLIGQGFGKLFGDQQGNVDLGGGNFYMPGQGFQRQTQGPATASGQVPTTSGFDFSNFIGSLFG